MKKQYLILFFIFLFALDGFAQKFNVSVGTSHIFYKNFNYRKESFHGISSNVSYYFKRIGWTFDFNYYLPNTYYGHRSYETFVEDEYTYVRIPIYIKSIGFYYGPGITYKAFVSKSQQTTVQVSLNGAQINYIGTYNKEPFIRINGGADDVTFGFFNLSPGIKITQRVRYIPITLILRRNFNLTNNENYGKINAGGFTEINLAVTFPIIYGSAPNKIKMINY
jgi:hypothetical protein